MTYFVLFRRQLSHSDFKALSVHDTLQSAQAEKLARVQHRVSTLNAARDQDYADGKECAARATLADIAPFFAIEEVS